MMLTIHNSIKQKLDSFLGLHKIPNIIFHGPSGSGKRTIVNEFIHKIYNNDKKIIKTFVMYVNCAHGKGIKFIRDDLKFFARSHINSNGGENFKSIVLLNADKLTMDAQSALRRCIELFSHNTRFFIVVENKYNMLKPILSRFCEIHIPSPTYDGSIINLYTHNINETFNMNDKNKIKLDWLKKELVNIKKLNDISSEILMSSSVKFYEKGYSCMDLLQLIEKNDFIYDNTTAKYELIMCVNRIKREFRNEKLLMLFVLNFVFLSLELSLENISFM